MWRFQRSLTISCPWPGPTSNSSPTRTWFGRLMCLSCRATPACCGRPRGGSPPSHSRQRSPMSWPPGRPTNGERCQRDDSLRTAGSGGDDPLTDLVPHLTGLVEGLAGHLGDGRGQLLFHRLKAGLEELRGTLDEVVQVLDALGHLVASVGHALVEREVIRQLVLELNPPDLGPLVAQHAEADGHVGRVAGQISDALGEAVDVGQFRHVFLLVSRLVVTAGTRSGDPIGP